MMMMMMMMMMLCADRFYGFVASHTGLPTGLDEFLFDADAHVVAIISTITWHSLDNILRISGSSPSFSAHLGARTHRAS